jgi:hypothetical protein
MKVEITSLKNIRWYGMIQGGGGLGLIMYNSIVQEPSIIRGC